MKRIKVLYIIDSLGPGGTERRLVQLLGGLDPELFSTKVILLTDIVHYTEVHELETEVIKLDRRIKKDPLIYFRLFGICRKWRPDIMHVWGSMPAIYAGPVAKILRIKQRIRSFLSFPLSDVIQSNSYAGLEAYNVPERKRNVIHNGFDFGRIGTLKDKNAIREELHIETRYVAGMVAGFKYQKDYNSLIHAAMKIHRQRDDITFVCVGDGPELHGVKELARGNERIIFTGNRTDVESIINIFDIGILLTDLDKHGEGISNSLMEYMAAGKAVIATDGGGTKELVADGETGYLIPQKSPDLLAGKIDHLLNNDRLREEMGARGKDRIRDEFNLDVMVAGHISLYRRILNPAT